MTLHDLTTHDLSPTCVVKDELTECDLYRESTQLWNGCGIRDPEICNEHSGDMQQCQETEATMKQTQILIWRPV